MAGALEDNLTKGDIQGEDGAAQRWRRKWRAVPKAQANARGVRAGMLPRTIFDFLKQIYAILRILSIDQYTNIVKVRDSEQ